MSGSTRRTTVVVVLVSLLLPIAIALRTLSETGWDATIFVAFGEDAVPTREYAEQRLGDVFLRPAQGHDGKFFFVQANDPWVLSPDENASVLDRPLYRSQRMLYPLLAGGFGLFGPETIVWAMLLVNIVALGAGSWIVSRLSTQLGGSPWWGLAFALNLGFISEMNIGGAGVLAAAAAFAAVLAALRGKLLWVVIALVMAVLAREAMMITAVGIAYWYWRRGERRPGIATVGVPAAAVLGWATYLRLMIGSASVTSEVQEIGWPFVGFIEAFGSWTQDPVDMAAGLAIMLLFFMFVRRTLMSRHLLGYAFVGFTVLGVLFTEQVWHSYFDITRAVAPLITAFVLLVFVVPSQRQMSDPVNEQVFG